MEQDTFSCEILEDVRILSRIFHSPFSMKTFDMRAFAQFRCKNLKTPLHYAVFEERHQLTRVLLEYGADVNAVDIFGSTPLHDACNSGKSLCAYIILEFKPDLNVQNAEFDTPLNKLVTWSFNFKRLLEKLLDAGADPNIPDIFGYTPLHNAVTCHSPTIAVEYAQILMRYKATADVQTVYQKTPLHVAVERNYHSVAKFLLENGASVNIEDQFGNTPMDSALSLQRCGTKTIELLGMHIIKQYCCKIEVNQKNLIQLIRIDNLRKFKEECDKEVLVLKSSKLGNTLVTYYDILVSTPNKIGRNLRNCEILAALKEADMSNYIFGDWLSIKSEDGLTRYNAVDKGYKFCCRIFHPLAHVCIDKIVTYLSNDDLYNLKRSFHPEVNYKDLTLQSYESIYN